jgi:transmembrane channel-like protein
MAQSYRKSFIQTSGNIENMLSHKVFCSWDWGIANPKAARLKNKNICSEFRELLEDIGESDENEVQPSKLRIFWAVTSKVTGHLLVLGLIFGIAYGMWVVMEWYNEKLGAASTNSGNYSSTLMLPMTVSLSMLAMQMIFKWLSL